MTATIKQKAIFTIALSMLVTTLAFGQVQGVGKGPHNRTAKTTEGLASGMGTDCVFTNPDSSLAGIKMEDARSTALVLGKRIKLEGDSSNPCYSKNKSQIMMLTVWPGAFYNEVSVFGVRY